MMTGHNKVNVVSHVMVQQASAKKKEKEVTAPAFASITAADIIRAPVVERSIPLNFLPLLKPFKRAGRLFLRVERLPQRAKMSAGKRNNDGSWSLASDELEDLEYLVPSNAPIEHELTIRVMTFEDGAASTLKVLQHPIRLEEIPDTAGNDDAISRSKEPHDPILRSQLGEMQSLFAVRESELAELRAAVQQAKSESAAELQKARTAWEQELHQRLAAVTEQADQHQEHEHKRRDAKNQTTLKQAEERWRMQESVRTAAAHAEWQRQVAHERAEHVDKNTKLETLLAAETDKRRKLEAALAQAMTQIKPVPVAGDNAPDLDRLRGELVGVNAALAEREQELARNRTEQDKEREAWATQTSQRLETEQKRWQAETEQRAEAERQRWQAETVQRIEAERQKWQSDADQRALVERERSRMESAHQLEAERQRWHAETAQRIESERQALTPHADQRVAAERERWQAEARHQLESEHQRWEAETEQRAARERQAFQTQTDQRVALERERWLADAKQQLESEHRRWQAEADHLAAKERQAWQVQADQRLEQERKRHEAEGLASLKRAEESWKAQEAARVAAASAEWQQLSARMLLDEKDKASKLEVSLAVEADKCRKLEAALAQALTQASQASSPGDGALDRLREELAGAQAALAARETELVRNRAEREQERNRWQQDAQASLDAKAAVWKAEEATRLKVMAEARAQSDEALAQMTVRCESAEQALTDIRSRKPASHEDDGYIESLRSEVAELRNALVKSETELGWARSALDQAQPLHIRRAAENLPIGMSLPQQQEQEAETTVSNKQPLVRDFLIVIAVVVPVILFYPWFAGYLPEGIRSSLATATGGLLSTSDPRPAAAPAVTPVPAPVVERPSMIVSRSVNVRTTPATKAAVLLTVPKGGSLIVLEQNGNWTHVEVPAKDPSAKAQQGWVFSANLTTKKESAKEDVKNGADSNVKADAARASAMPEAAKSAAPPAVEPVPADHSLPANTAPPASSPPEPAPAGPSQ